jgi:hypothetical protein
MWHIAFLKIFLLNGKITDFFNLLGSVTSTIQYLREMRAKLQKDYLTVYDPQFHIELCFQCILTNGYTRHF